MQVQVSDTTKVPEERMPANKKVYNFSSLKAFFINILFVHSYSNIHLLLSTACLAMKLPDSFGFKKS
jgi:hypothetical protein